MQVKWSNKLATIDTKELSTDPHLFLLPIPQLPGFKWHEGLTASSSAHILGGGRTVVIQCYATLNLATKSSHGSENLIIYWSRNSLLLQIPIVHYRVNKIPPLDHHPEPHDFRLHLHTQFVPTMSRSPKWAFSLRCFDKHCIFFLFP